MYETKLIIQMSTRSYNKLSSCLIEINYEYTTLDIVLNIILFFKFGFIVSLNAVSV